jgi:hypothetical protein
MRIPKQLLALVAIGVAVAFRTAWAGENASTELSAQAATADAGNYVQLGKELRHEIQGIYADLKRRHALGSPRRGNDVTDVVLKYIPAGTSFDTAEAILRNAGCKIGTRPADIPKPARPLEPQEPVLATLHLGGWPLGHYLSVALVPRENGDYSTVTRVSATILMAYS